jgi:hypothetical protein
VVVDGGDLLGKSSTVSPALLEQGQEKHPQGQTDVLRRKGPKHVPEDQKSDYDIHPGPEYIDESAGDEAGKVVHRRQIEGFQRSLILFLPQGISQHPDYILYPPRM